jgi:hypothetical protein
MVGAGGEHEAAFEADAVEAAVRPRSVIWTIWAKAR